MRKIPFYYLAAGSYGQNIRFIEKSCVMIEDSVRLNNPDDLYEFSKVYLYKDYPAEEYVYMIGLNTSCTPIAVCEISHGTAKSSLVNPREILIRALRMGATGFVLVHNHVSGALDPSWEDYAVTNQVKCAGRIIGLPMYEHIVVGENGYSCVTDHPDKGKSTDQETIAGYLHDMLMLSNYEIKTILYDPKDGAVKMALPSGKWQIRVERLPRNAVI